MTVNTSSMMLSLHYRLRPEEKSRWELDFPYLSNKTPVQFSSIWLHARLELSLTSLPAFVQRWDHVVFLRLTGCVYFSVNTRVSGRSYGRCSAKAVSA